MEGPSSPQTDVPLEPAIHPDITPVNSTTPAEHTPRLAPEIWFRIISFTGADGDNSTLLSLALVSKEVGSAAYSVLYRSIKITWTPHMAGNIMRSFEENPRLCVLVRELEVAVHRGKNETVVSTTTNGEFINVEMATGETQSRPLRSGFLWRWASSLVNLKRVRLGYFRVSIGPESSDEVTSIFSRLSHLALCNCGVDDNRSGLYNYVANLESIESLDIQDTLGIPPTTSASPPPQTRGPSVVHLSLGGEETATLASLDLPLDMNHIRSLRLDACCRIPHFLSVLPTLSSLRSLSLTAKPNSFGAVFPIPFWECISQLALSTLHVNFWPDEPILLLLPSSLRLLHINDARKNGLSDALAYKTRYLPELEKLWVQSDFLANRHGEWCREITCRAVGFSLAVRTKAAIDEDIHESCRLEG